MHKFKFILLVYLLMLELGISFFFNYVTLPTLKLKIFIVEYSLKLKSRKLHVDHKSISPFRIL